MNNPDVVGRWIRREARQFNRTLGTYYEHRQDLPPNLLRDIDQEILKMLNKISEKTAPGVNME